MREILFRGKRRLGNEWIEGSLHTEKFTDDEEYLCCEINQCDVYPETVGQYTGLTDDKNGKKIFEGDIVAVYVKGCRTICTVSWAETVAHFQLWQINTIPGTPTALNLGNYDCEVIGNIYDNPELLKGGAE